MKTTDKIPTGKLERAGKILKTGLKVGKNYASYYGEKIIGGEASKDKLDRSNAEDIMSSLHELKGSGLKVAQMLSMEQHLLPAAYVEQFSLAQFSVPPLSGPLIKKTFVTNLGKAPEQIFDTFDYDSKYAASIGQVHKATKGGLTFAVKIQYPGVASSIRSDLAMLKPLAGRIMRINISEAQHYFDEVENKLLEETDYELELQQSMELAQACSDLENVVFPRYYPEYSTKRILTMDWIEGVHLSEFIKTNPSQEFRNKYGQQLWDLFMYQIHRLRKVHADPHPGNIIVTQNGKLGIIDFGCVKAIPESFYEPYFALVDPISLEDESKFDELLHHLEILREDDEPVEKAYFTNMFKEVLGLLLSPFRSERFDFGDKRFFEQVTTTGERIAKDALSSGYKPNRGSAHFLYMNRTFFGIYNLLHLLASEINTSVDKGRYS